MTVVNFGGDLATPFRRTPSGHGKATDNSDKNKNAAAGVWGHAEDKEFRRICVSPEFAPVFRGRCPVRYRAAQCCTGVA